MLQRHPTTKQLIHRVQQRVLDGSSADDAAYQAAADPFVPTEDDPSKTRALESSLWELEALRKHYYPPISKFAKVFGTNFTKAKYELDDFMVCVPTVPSFFAVFVLSRHVVRR
jgi:U3 small nucleolar RNA-associated protein 19